MRAGDADGYPQFFCAPAQAADDLLLSGAMGRGRARNFSFPAVFHPHNLKELIVVTNLVEFLTMLTTNGIVVVLRECQELEG